MISKEQGKNLAGKIFVQHFGADFVRANINRLATAISHDNSSMTVYFELFPVDLYADRKPQNKIGYNPDTSGEYVFIVKVNRRTAKAEVLDLESIA